MNANNWEQKQLEILHWLISLIQLHPLGHNHDEGQAYESTNLEGSQSTTSQSLFDVTL